MNGWARFFVALGLIALVAWPGALRTQARASQEYVAGALDGEPHSIDPSRATFTTDLTVVRQVFEPLLKLDESLRPAPAAAERYEVSPDGTTWTFHLRPDGRFSDGTPVTAAHFEYAFKRLLDPAIASPYASFFVDAGIVGAAEYNAGRAPTPDLVGVRALDDLTLQVQLGAPAGFFPSLVTLPVAAPLRRDIVEARGESWTLDPASYVGNGPFVMTRWVHQDHMTFAPNPYYHGPGPHLQQMTLRVMTDMTVEYAAYLNGERDQTLVPPGLTRGILSDPQLSGEAHRWSLLATSWIAVNHARTPLDSLLVRQALSRAIDREALVRDTTDGLGRPATSLIPPGMPGFQDELGKDLDFDPAAARALLAQAGYPDPARFPKLSLSYGAATEPQRRAEFIQAQLKQHLGIELVLNPLEAKAYMAAYRSSSFELALIGSGAEYPDPQVWLRPNFGCDGSANRFNYCNPAFDQLVARADATLDQAERLRLYAEAQALLVQDAPGIWLRHSEFLTLVKPHVRGIVVTPVDEYPGNRFFDRVWIDGR